MNPPIQPDEPQFPSIQEQLESAWEHVFEENETLEEFLDDPGYDYQEGFSAGYDAGLYHNSFQARWDRLIYPIERRIPYAIRNRWFRVRRLFDKNAIPF